MSTASADGLYRAPLGGTASLRAASPETTLRLRLDAAGNLGPTAGGVVGVTLDEERLHDLILLATVRVAP